MKRRTYPLAAAILLVAGLAACQKQESTAQPGPAERVGKQIDQATAKAGEELNKAAAKAGAEMKDAGQKLQEKASDAQADNEKK
ncbi:hypothetical protein [Noviherbaspirillum galbum]|uniref:Apolipophorin n=1 Tax=Noviherbaspirillum galbum TaxID=2709383 RepID=A0A6B3SGD9_9BURK|nr:hypothetical protein [Noviherbaspirillum galbum]NEX59924.1 hypothetical protein [Noviherbaspirillum galbum]